MSFMQRHFVIACTVTERVEAEQPDTHGNPIYEDGVPVPTMCWIAPRSGPESSDGRSVESGWTVYLPASLAGRVSAFSRLDVEGYGSLEVEGDPAVHRSLATRWPTHVEVTARRSTA